jgi:hypothetical protein
MNEIEEFEDGPIMPEGFEEGQDIFNLPEDEDAPTIELPAEGEKSDEEGLIAEDETTPTTEAEETKPQTGKAKIKVRFNHEDREMDEDEAIPVIQKGLNYDKVDSRNKELEGKMIRFQKLAKTLGYTSDAEMLDAAETNYIESKVTRLVDEGVHEAIARDLVARELERESHKQPEQVAAVEKDKDLDEFVRLNPGVTKLPDEVLAAVKEGVPLTVAYERFKNKKAADEIKILKQNQSSAAKAPVAATTKHGSTKQKAKDAFEEGFDSDGW